MKYLTKYQLIKDTSANTGSLMVISPSEQLAHILEVVLTVSPISENCGLWIPMTPAITLPLCIPIFNLKGFLLLTGP